MTGKHSASRQPAYRGRAVALAYAEDVQIYRRHRRRSVAARLWRRAAVLGGVGVAAVAATLGGVHEASPGGLGGFGEVDAAAEPAPPPMVDEPTAGDTTLPAGSGLLVSGGLVGVAERGVLNVPDTTVTSAPPSSTSSSTRPAPTPTSERSLVAGSVAETGSAPSPSGSAEEPSTTREPKPTGERTGESSTRHPRHPRSEHTESRPSHTDDSTSPQPSHDHGDQSDHNEGANDDDSTADRTDQTGDSGSDGLLGGLLGR